MLNRAPIFINGFSYGGTDLIVNILASHPEVCLLSGETDEVFHSKSPELAGRIIRRAAAWPLEMLAGGELTRTTYLFDRRPLPRLALRYLDLIFYMDKLTSPKNNYKSEGVRYTLSEVRASRFLAKSVNGTVLVNDIFASAYPDATFIAIVRDGLALCESYTRRGRSADKIGAMYDRVSRKMLEYSGTIESYHIVRFEDMVADPVGFMRTVYAYAGLDPAAVTKVRLQSKPVTHSDGTRKYVFGSGADREVNWFPVEDLPRHIIGNANENQRLRLSDKDRDAFLGVAGGAMKELGYEI